MSADMAIELRKYNVACVTLYPGPVITEIVDNMKKNDTSGVNKFVLKRIADCHLAYICSIFRFMFFFKNC